MPTFQRLALALALTAATLASAAHAQTAIVDSRPRQGSVAAGVTSVDIAFSEPVTAAALTLTLVMTAMPRMAMHKPMLIKGFATKVTDRQASLRFPRPLPAGSYRLDWSVAGDAAGRASGSLTFRAQ
jgi:hypothetical protein